MYSTNVPKGIYGLSNSLPKRLFGCFLAVGPLVLHTARVTLAFLRAVSPFFLVDHCVPVRQLSPLSLCGRLFLPLRSFLSDEECLYHDSIVQFFCSVCKNASWPGEGGEGGERRKKSVQTQHSLRCVFGSHRITVEPIRALILHDQNTCACPLLVSFSTLRIL